MARNLRKKIPQSDTMIVQDINPDVSNDFAKQVGDVQVATTVREVAENAVRTASRPACSPYTPTMMNVFFMF